MPNSTAFIKRGVPSRQHARDITTVIKSRDRFENREGQYMKAQWSNNRTGTDSERFPTSTLAAQYFGP